MRSKEISFEARPPIQPSIRWPHVMGIDSGFVHPTAAAIVTCSPEGHILVPQLYVAETTSMRVHARTLIEMKRECGQVGNPDFYSMMADARDPYFAQGLREYTNPAWIPYLDDPSGRSPTPEDLDENAERDSEISPLIDFRKEDGSAWGKPELRAYAIRRLMVLFEEGKFWVNPGDTGPDATPADIRQNRAYRQFVKSWASWVWDPNSYDERPKKMAGDDPMDSLMPPVISVPQPDRDDLRKSDPRPYSLVGPGEKDSPEPWKEKKWKPTRRR